MKLKRVVRQLCDRVVQSDDTPGLTVNNCNVQSLQPLGQEGEMKLQILQFLIWLLIRQNDNPRKNEPGSYEALDNQSLANERQARPLNSRQQARNEPCIFSSVSRQTHDHGLSGQGLIWRACGCPLISGVPHVMYWQKRSRFQYRL